MLNIVENKKEIVDLILLDFKDTSGYSGSERNIHKTGMNDKGEIISSVFKSDQSSIYYNYKIDMSVKVSDSNVQILIKTETAASNGDPYCGRGMNRSTKDYDCSKNISEFKTIKEIADYIRSTFYKYYFRINQRN